MNGHHAVILRGIGMSSGEIRYAELPVEKPFPASNGFGLIGPTGTGKTVMLCQHVGQLVDDMVGETLKLAPNNFAVWINWPDTAETIKSLSGPANWDQLDQLEWRMKHCRRLYLDDIGQERIRGEDDLSLGHIKVILDHRYRDGLPVFWSSNLGPDQLSAIYGARTVSRMIQAWPPVMVAGPDRRMPQ